MADRLATDELCAGDVMSRHFLSAAPEDTLGELAERLAEADAGSALVVEYGRLTGILTSRDVVRAVADTGPPKRGSRARLDEPDARHGRTRAARRRGGEADAERRLSSPARYRGRSPSWRRWPAGGRRRASSRTAGDVIP